MNISDLKKRKKELKLTTAELAYLAELPVSTVSKIMTGETRTPSYVTIEKIDKALTKEEMRIRIEAYKKAIEKYLSDHPDEDFDESVFETYYRRINDLTDAPIPYAVKKKATTDNNLRSGSNLALNPSTPLNSEILHDIGEDRSIELLDGHLIINEAPGVRHQLIVQNTGKIIDKYISDHGGKCMVFNVGINVCLGNNNDTVLIPDIAVVCNPDLLDEYGIHGAPDWVIEVVSKSTKHRDYNAKMHKYMSCGVREYWIVDPEKEKVTVYIEGEPMLAYVYGFDDLIPVYIYDSDLKIRPSGTLLGQL
ncbi:MAG: Uma2 family endonuclease [Lachnospiraceae bacterium]|nr:Uma2 family endonuclease [Lachnospiraceae bacterium]